MINKVMFVCILHCCYGWKIKTNEITKIQDLKTKCTFLCPFQKETADLYANDITCEVDCKIQHCVKGCHFLEKAFETDCHALCNVSDKAVKSSDLFCFMGCKQGLKAYFDSIKNEISDLQAPVLLDHTLSTTSLSLEWKEPNMMNESYVLQCCNVDLSSVWQFCQNQSWVSHELVNVEHLQPYTKYQFRVAVRLTPGDWYEIYSSPSPIIVTLPGGLPTSPPKILTATPVSSSIISVMWKEGQYTNGPIISYILQISELPVGYAGVKDIIATKKTHSHMLQNLQPSKNYSISISARNTAGLGPPATVTVSTNSVQDKTKEKVNLMIATEHSVYSISSDVHEEPVLMYNTTHVIKGIALHVHRELLFISDSSGGVIVTSSKGLLTPQEVLSPSSSKPSALTADWLNDHLYILSEVLHPSGSIVYQVARCALDGSNLIVVISGFIMKPHHIEVDPYNGYLFWVVRGVGLYRLDLIDISKVINQNVSPELILEDPNLGAFLVNYDNFRIIIPVYSQNIMISTSLDGQDIEKFREKVEEPRFQNVVSLAMINGSLYWTNGEHMYKEVCDIHNKSFSQNITDELSMTNCIAVVANTLYSQPIPVPLNPPTNFQAIFGHDIAKVSWEKPYHLAGQGEGAWSAWAYRLTVEDKNGSCLFDFSDIKTIQFTVSGLKPGTEYALKVAAYTLSGEGPWSVEFRGKTIHRNTSLLWSNDDGLLLSDVTGYRVTKIEPVNYLETDSQFLITDIDWYEDQVYVSTNKQQVFWYNLTSNTFGRIQDINGADCISIEWLAKKLYWGSSRNKMIFRANLSGTKQEILPIIAAVESLFLDSLAGYLYWSTRNTIEGACLDGTQRRIFYVSRNTYASQIVGLALDIRGSELYWIERSSIYPRRGALMITDTKQSIQRHNNDYLIDKFNLINQDVGGGLCYIDQHLVWVRADDRTAMVSGLNGTTTALLQTENLSNLVTCTAMDPFIRTSSNGTAPKNITVIPDAVKRSSIHIEGSYNLFNVTWDPISGVNYGKVFYRIRMNLNEEETILDTSDTFITVGNAKAYVPLKIALQSWTYWAIADPVRVTLHSPTSTPSPPMNPRIFVMHKKKPHSQEKEISALFRWSPPLQPNGVIQRYELSCWVNHNHTNASGTTCSSSQISAKTLEFTLQNLPINKTYYFQVRACTESGCGNWSASVKINFVEEFPIPRLLVTSNEGLIKMDYDRKSFGISITGTEEAKDTTYDADSNAIYWIENKSLCQSYLDAHMTNTKKLAILKNEGASSSYDWIAKHLYWVERSGTSSTIGSLDLNRNEDDRHANTVVQRNAVIENIIASPMNSMLYWVEVEEHQRTVGTLMKSFMDGSNVKEFFHKETTFSKNDVSSSSMYNSEEQDISCNCTRSIVGEAISLYPSSNNQYKLLWVEVSSGFIVSSDLGGCYCSKIINAASASKHGLPLSITADFKKVYWLDMDKVTLYSASVDENSSSIEKISTNGATYLTKILAYGSHLQLFPDFSCLWPRLKPNVAQLVKHSSDAITLELPSVKKDPLCKNVSMATVEYTLYYGVINNDGVSNCTNNVKSCSQAVTYDKIKKVTKLRPYTRYVFLVGVNNYYGQMRSIEPVISDSVIYRTAPGVPSPPRNIKAIPVTPYAILVKWTPPEYLNAAAARYSVFWYTTYDNGTDDAQENLPWRHIDTSVTLKGLLPSHNYTIWVKTFPVLNGGSIPIIGYSNSENITIQTFPEPGNLTLINVTSYFLNISLPSDLNKTRFDVEILDHVSKKWETVLKSSNHHVVLNGLFPLTLYKVRLKIWYTSLFPSAFLWLADGFEFKTSGDRPSTPGIPTLQHLKEDTYQIVWEPSNNYGLSILTYWLEGKYASSEPQSRDADVTDKYSNWTVYYNGTDNFWTASGLKHNVRYIFRVRGKNEYGWSTYSEVSEESELPSKAYTMIIIVWSILPIFCVIGLTTFTTFLYVHRCQSSKSKSVNFVKSGILPKSRSGDFELVNLRELPSGTNFVKDNNILYIPQDDDNQDNTEFSQMPRIRREQITLTKFLGSGAFGEVYEGTVKNLLYENIETKVAIKALRKNATEQEKVEFLKEAQLMNNFKHKHILQMLGICTDNNPNFIIMELMEGGDLLSYLRSNRSLTVGSSSLKFLDLIDICCDVASGCCYLEEMHFVHRDLACRNCLVSSKDPTLRIVKIGDFGLARDIYKNDYYRKEGEGLLPVRWMAPESLVDGVFTRHSDVWSFGVLLWEVMSLGQQPYQARSNVEVLQYVRSGGRLNCPMNCPLRMYKLMEKCWNFQPKERPTFEYCLSELEELKNNCNLDLVNLNYTTLLPITDYRDGEENVNHSNGTNIEYKKKTRAKLCTAGDTEMANLIENQLENLEKLPFKL